jgi:GDP-L-fucose synthase
VLFCLVNDLKDDVINVGYGKELSIFDLAQLVKSLIKYEGDIIWDVSKPDGTPRKLLDSSKMNQYGWNPKINLEDGITQTIRWFRENL